MAEILWLDEISQGSFATFSEEAAETLAVFVHGFWGDAKNTWLNFPGFFQDMEDIDAIFFKYDSFNQSIMSSAHDLIAFLEKTLGLHPEFSKRNYARFVLVGHSEGCVVIRQAVQILTAPSDAESSTPQRDHLSQVMLRADLALFAPAHLGFAPSGYLGVLMNFGILGTIAHACLSRSPAYTEMHEKTLLKNLQNFTEWHQDNRPDMSSYFARVVFGREDKLVVRGAYRADTPADEQRDRDHISLCKPTLRYTFPLEFVLKGGRAL